MKYHIYVRYATMSIQTDCHEDTIYIYSQTHTHMYISYIDIDIDLQSYTATVNI